MNFKKVGIDRNYAIVFVGIIIIAIMAFDAGRAYEQKDSCDYFIKEHAKVVIECNAKIRACNNIPVEFNLSEVLKLNGSG